MAEHGIKGIQVRAQYPLTDTMSKGTTLLPEVRAGIDDLCATTKEECPSPGECSLGPAAVDLVKNGLEVSVTLRCNTLMYQLGKCMLNGDELAGMDKSMTDIVRAVREGAIV